ncbi:MAG: twin-arginine translocation signal domain-containing protein, partial [Rhizobacter sp.]|nr:twin-arginine translocation signal domain-containing protein [Chlorobiales bacterium]
MTTRRDFLKTSAAIAAAATLFHKEALGFATAIAAKPKVIILGAGFAGL